jgi:transposase-like protein
MTDTPKRRARRQFTDEFKAGVVRLVLDEGKTVGAVARDMDLTDTAVREWVKRAQADRTHGRLPASCVQRADFRQHATGAQVSLAVSRELHLSSVRQLSHARRRTSFRTTPMNQDRDVCSPEAVPNGP